MATATLNSNPIALGQDAKIMALVGLAHGSSHFGHMLLPPLFPLFMREFGLSFSQVGALMTVFFVISGIGQALMGFVVDRVGARPALFTALATFALACLAASLAQGYGGLVLAAALAGLANSPFHPADFTILDQRISTPRIGYSFSVHGITGSLGWALAPPFFVLMLSLADWRQAYLAAALLYVGVLALLVWNRQLLSTQVARSGKEPAHSPSGVAAGEPSDALAKTAAQQAIAQPAAAHSLAFMKLAVVWWCFGFFLFSTMTLAVVQSYSVPLLQALHHSSFEAATATLTAYMFCGALGMLVGGFVSARFAAHSDRVVAWCMAAGAVFMALCASGWLGAVGSMVLLALAGLAIGIGGPSRDMMIKRAAPKGATGRVYGTVYSGLDVGFALSPIVFGQFMDRGWYGGTLLGAALTLLVSVAAALAVGKRTAAASLA
jgi:MFS transporter, FSR family, fosmidomycin resistance protein